jgi:hypothetical protein
MKANLILFLASVLVPANRPNHKHQPPFKKWHPDSAILQWNDEYPVRRSGINFR